MARPFVPVFPVLSLALLALYAQPSIGQPLPQLSVQTLTGKRLLLPRDLNPTSILVVGFTKSSRRETAPWVKRLREDPQVATGASVYEVVVLGDVPGFLRSLILKQLQSGIPKERQDQCLIVTEAVGTWKQFLRATETDSAYVVVVAPKGNISWLAHGAITDEAYSQLKRALSTAR